MFGCVHLISNFQNLGCCGKDHNILYVSKRLDRMEMKNMTKSAHDISLNNPAYTLDKIQN